MNVKGIDHYVTIEMVQWHRLAEIGFLSGWGIGFLAGGGLMWLGAFQGERELRRFLNSN